MELLLPVHLICFGSLLAAWVPRRTPLTSVLDAQAFGGDGEPYIEPENCVLNMRRMTSWVSGAPMP
jgi:hypothetical protein